MCFYESHDIALSANNILAALSLIIWSLILVVTVKYIMFVMRADNEREGGILALMALSGRQRPPRHGGWVPLALGVAIFTLMTTWHRGRAIFKPLRRPWPSL